MLGVSWVEQTREKGGASKREIDSRAATQPTATLVHAVSGEVIQASGDTELLLFCSPAAAVGRDFHQMVHPDDLVELLGSQEACVSCEGTWTRVRRRDGTWLEVRSRRVEASPGRDAIERILVALAPQGPARTGEGDTGPALAEARTLAGAIPDQRAREALLEARLEAMVQLVGGLAHEFNNAVAAAKSNIHWAEGEAGRLSPGPEADDLQGALADTRAAIGHLGLLVGDLRRFTHIDDHTAEGVRLDELVQAAVSMARSKVRPFSSLVLEVKAGAPVSLNPVRLTQILLNLIYNAVDAFEGRFRPENKIHVRAGRAELGWWVEVEDNGVGIAPDQLDRILDPYFTTKVTGTGLGLPLVSGFAKEMGAALTVRSVLGQGSVFRVETRRVGR